METTKTFNMIVLGGFLKIKPIVKMENVIAGLKKSLPERYHHLLPLNEKALRKGSRLPGFYKLSLTERPRQAY